MTRRKAASPRDATFFDRFRAAVARLPTGLIRLVPPAAPADVARAEAALGRALPSAYASFLQSFDGADLFHESVLVAGVGPDAPRALTELAQDRPDELMFAEAQSGDRFALDAGGRVWRYDPGAEERALAGTDFARWLDATVAREQVLFGPDGEYAPDVFDTGGEEVVPEVALRQAERALKVDPGAADATMPAAWRWPTSDACSRRWRRLPPRRSSTRKIPGPGSISVGRRWSLVVPVRRWRRFAARPRSRAVRRARASRRGAHAPLRRRETTPPPRRCARRRWRAIRAARGPPPRAGRRPPA